jgi:hypothetical protein
MRLKPAIFALAFFVALGAVIVGQRAQLRAFGFAVAGQERELQQLEEQNRVLRLELARKRDPAHMIRLAREAGLNLLPPEDNLPVIPGRPREQVAGGR